MTSAKTDEHTAVKLRIKALLSKTVENGCTEAEAIAAAEKATEMLRRYGLREDDIFLARVRSASSRSKRRKIDDLWGVVGTVCRCRVSLTKDARGAIVWEFIGRDPWPDIADWLRQTLSAAYDRAATAYRASDTYQRRRSLRTKALARGQFTAGYVESLRLKLWKMARPGFDDIKRELEIVEQMTADEFKKARSLSFLKIAKYVPNAIQDREAGRVAGRTTNLAWGLANAKMPALYLASEQPL